MVTVALWVKMEAKPGKEREVAAFLQMGALMAQQEPDTTAWFAMQLGPTTFAVFDAFPDERGRQAHLTGRLAAELMARYSFPVSTETRISSIRSVTEFQS